MRKSIIFCTAILILAFSISVAAKTKYKVFRPEGAGKSAFLQSDGKKYKYFTLERGQVIDFSVIGPTKVKIRVRPAMEGGIKSANFEIQVWEGKKMIVGRKAESGKSKLKVDDKGVDVGLARDLFFKAPRGRHNYEIKVVSSDLKKSYVRFYQEKKKRKPKYISYKPSKFGETVKLKSSKSDITYYLVNKEGGVELSVIGPAEVMIYCRTNFDKNIKEKSKFGLGVFENGETVKNFTGIAKKSTKSVYADRTDLIPSTLHKYTLNVPSGKHTYTFKKVNSAAPNIGIRFKMKENSLGKKK
ncbi:MAG: hypothetical protein JSW64_03930 [Candidatus Zixiibacteriota bacterium]|nr:MAG: hypothetical protein JSW64_03930 [candidate division Zixibacteria bacterium]